MRSLFLAVAILALSATAQAGGPKGGHHGNTTKFYSQTGRPQGHATTSGNTTRFYSQAGRPQGKATTSGNTTKFYNQSGRPMGKVTR